MAVSQQHRPRRRLRPGCRAIPLHSNQSARRPAAERRDPRPRTHARCLAASRRRFRRAERLSPQSRHRHRHDGDCRWRRRLPEFRTRSRCRYQHANGFRRYERRRWLFRRLQLVPLPAKSFRHSSHRPARTATGGYQPHWRAARASQRRWRHRLSSLRYKPGWPGRHMVRSRTQSIHHFSR